MMKWNFQRFPVFTLILYVLFLKELKKSYKIHDEKHLLHQRFYEMKNMKR